MLFLVKLLRFYETLFAIIKKFTHCSSKRAVFLTFYTFHLQNNFCFAFNILKKMQGIWYLYIYKISVNKLTDQEEYFQCTVWLDFLVQKNKIQTAWDEPLTLFQFWFLFPIVPLTWIYYFIHSDFSCFIWTNYKALSPEIQWFHSCKRKWPLFL